MNRPANPFRSLASFLVCLLSVGGIDTCGAEPQGTAVAERTPVVLARESFQAIKQGRFREFAEMLHPEELSKFKAFAVAVAESAASDQQTQGIQQLFKPFSDPESLAGAAEVDVVEAFLKGTTERIPGYQELLADAKLELLGEVKEDDDLVHVVYRAILPRARLITCGRHEGTWRLMLSEDMTRLMNSLELKSHFEKKGLDSLEILRLLSSMRIHDMRVLGHVKDGNDAAQVVCRVTMKADDYTQKQLGVYPVRRGEPAWSLLDQPDQEPLAAALKKKWEGQ